MEGRWCRGRRARKRCWYRGIRRGRGVGVEEEGRGRVLVQRNEGEEGVLV